MTTNPLVTILINNYNYADFLADAIESCLEQMYDKVEIIIVDDGSQDGSRSIIENYGNQVIPIFKNNGGQASAFNIGFSRCKGDIICFLDSDDYFFSEKIATIVDIFTNHPEIGWLFHPLKLSGHHSSVVEQSPSSDLSGVYDIRHHISRGKLQGKLPFMGIITSGMCFRRSLLQQILPMPEEIRITSDDYIKYSALGLSQGYILLENLATQRIHGNNAYTFRDDKQELKAKTMILTAYYLKKNFKFLSAFANNIFALGFSIYQSVKSDPVEYSSLLHSYLSSLTLWEKCEINVRTMYYRLRN
ncbi:MAG: glycosyltransferase family 2 protein [Cyanobacteria bacterium J06621_8]